MVRCSTCLVLLLLAGFVPSILMVVGMVAHGPCLPRAAGDERFPGQPVDHYSLGTSVGPWSNALSAETQLQNESSEAESEALPPWPGAAGDPDWPRARAPITWNHPESESRQARRRLDL